VLRDRLDAQSLIWAITKAKPDGPLLASWSDDERDAFFRWRDGTGATTTKKQEEENKTEEKSAEPTEGFEERLSSAAAKIHLPVAYLRNLTALLLNSDKKQLVLYGSPGT